jgi:Secretion system C-terminal sorting domain
LIEIIKKVLMKKSLLFLILLFINICLHAQKDTLNIIGVLPQKDISARDVVNNNVTIYPVPVRENSFTIKTDRDVSFVKITNIIGQDIYRVKYNNPQQLNKIFLDNPKRGVYLVTIIFSEGTRIVKKIMVEESE